jgi:hypothetical protein
VTSKADAYPEIPWKAYALGSAFGAALAAVNPLVIAGWSHASVIAFDLVFGRVKALLAKSGCEITQLDANAIDAEVVTEHGA